MIKAYEKRTGKTLEFMQSETKTQKQKNLIKKMSKDFAKMMKKAKDKFLRDYTAAIPEIANEIEKRFLQ